MIAAALMLFGAVFVLVAAVGLHRFDDVFARMHAAGKASTFGFGFILAGVAVRLDDLGAAFKLTLIGITALVTIPAGVHIIARAAWRAGSDLAAATEFDERSRRRQAQTRRDER